MKRLFSLFAAIVMVASVFAGRTFSGTEVLYLNAGAVSWWQDGGAVQRASFDGGELVIGVAAADPSKVGFTVPAGTYETVVFSRASSATAGAWNSTGAISLDGTTGNMVATFDQNSTVATWGNYDGSGIDKPTCPDALYALGNIKNVGWNPGQGAAFTKNGQVFTSDTLEFVADGTNTICYFCFTSTNSTNWADVNAARYGTKNNIVPGGAGVELSYPGEKNATIVPGHYVITVDWTTMLVTAQSIEVAPDTVIPAGVVLWPAAAVLPTAVPAEVKILSLNNSLIHYENEFQDVMFNQMAAAMGKNAAWTAHTNLGKTLKYHWDEGEGLTETNTSSARKLMRDNAYTHIILQEQTNKPLTNFKGFRESVIQWVEYIRTESANPNAVIILPINWALVGSGDIHANNAKLKQAYLDLAQELGLVLSPVGVAYELAYTADNTIMAQGNRWFKDDRHPTQMTTYLGAVLEYSMIYGVDPTTITWAPTTVTPTEAGQMRTLAQQAIAATAQPVNIYNHTIRFEVRQLDTDGNSIATLGATYSGEQLTDSTFSCATAGEYNVTAVCGEDNLSATVKVADMVTVVVKLPSIKVNTTNTTVAENFDTMTYPAADATVIEKGYYGKDYALPTAWRMERNQVGPRTIGTYADAMLTAQYGGGANLPTGAANGTWNLGMNGSSDRALGGMTTGVADGARTINIMTHLENDGTKAFDTIRVSYDIEKYREGSNANEFYVKLFTSTNGVAWTEAGEDFAWLNPKGAGQTGFATVPGFTQHVEADLVCHFAAGTELYLCWSISTSAGDNCASAPCLAIDNVNLEFVAEALPEAAHYIYVDDQSGWDCISVYAYGTAEIYGAWPGQVVIDEQEIGGVTYKVFPFDVTEDAEYKLIFNNCNNGSQAADFIANEARDYYLTVTATAAAEKVTGLTNVNANANVRKYVHNGEVIIIRDGVRYNVMGAKLYSK